MLFKFNDTKKYLTSTFHKEFSSEIAKTVEEIIETLQFPSLQVSILTRTNQSITCSSGYSNMEKRNKSTIKHLYFLASLSKLYTQAVILKLVQDNLIGLEDSVHQYIDVGPQGTQLSILNLLNHSSGLHDPLKTNENLYGMLRYGVKWSTDRYIHEVKRHPPYFEPGSSREYSNTGYILLGAIAEKVTNRSFSTLLNEFFIRPLKLNNTYYSLERAELPSKHIATGYDKYYYGKQQHEPMVNIDEYCVHLPIISYASGGVLSYSMDVCRFIRKIMDGDVFEEIYKKVFRRLYTIKNISGITCRAQTGYLPGYKNFFVYSQSKGFVIVGLTNYSDAADDDFTIFAAESLLNSMLKHKVISS